MGLISSLARPGGNITGLDVATAELRAKSLQLLREAVPKASLIGFLMRPDNLATMSSWQELDAAARTLGVKVRRFDAREPADIDGVFALLVRERVGALLVANDATFVSEREKIVDLATKNRVPALYASRLFVEAGSLCHTQTTIVILLD